MCVEFFVKTSIRSDPTDSNASINNLSIQTPFIFNSIIHEKELSVQNLLAKFQFDLTMNKKLTEV